jgi:endoglucanase
MPYGTPDIPPLNEMNQLFVDTVRAQGGANATRALLVAGFNTDIDKTCVSEFQLPTDPAGPGKLFLSLHYYTPYQFTILEDSSAFTTWGTSEDQTQLDGLFTKLAAFSAERKVPVILGEFATTKMRASNYRVAWMTAVAKAALSRGIVPVLWDTGADISRTDGALSSELQSAFSAVKYPN